MSRLVVRVARQTTVVLLFVLAAVLGTVSGVLFVYAGDLPQISALDDYAPSTITRVYASNGEVIGEFATQRRVVISYDQIAPVLRQAIIAAEDEEFESHFGLSIQRIVLTLIKDIMERRLAAGASTLTQQLARNLFPIGFEKTWERKIKEALLAIQIEKRYTKAEILTFYCNQNYWGHGAYGVEAASRLYFGKSAKDLNLEEAALIAGIVQLPSRQSPYVDREWAMRRRNYALQRMADAGYISQAEADAAKKRPIVTVGLPDPHDSDAPFFVEEVRKHLEAKYGARALYENGLSVQTSLDLKLQLAANKAIDEGLRRIDKRRGWRTPKQNVVKEGHDPATFDPAGCGRPVSPGDIVPAVVTRVDARSFHVRCGAFETTIDREGFAWTRRTSATQLVKVGDVVSIRVTGDKDGRPTGASLDQEPEVQGALLAIENRTGRILAMVGGSSFQRSKFNRAVQAYRQLGSTFKPILYTAAIDRGFTPASIIVDAPVAFPAGPGQPPYSPANYDHRYEGPVTLRRALEQSRNVPAVKLMDQLGPQQVIDYARRLGFKANFQPYLSTALGAGEATLLEVTSAFSVFPNQGVRMQPHEVIKVIDRQGNVLEENRPEPIEAIRADTAFVMANLLQGVVQRGTAARAASLNWPLGGKTGTTDDYTDAWFIGFDPDITVGVWVGLDQKKPIGYNETGAVAALPIWMDFMRAYIAGRKDDRPEFTPPGNIVFLRVGTNPDGTGGITEAFISGTQPGGAFRQ